MLITLPGPQGHTITSAGIIYDVNGLLINGVYSVNYQIVSPINGEIVFDKLAFNVGHILRVSLSNEAGNMIFAKSPEEITTAGEKKFSIPDVAIPIGAVTFSVTFRRTVSDGEYLLCQIRKPRSAPLNVEVSLKNAQITSCSIPSFVPGEPHNSASGIRSSSFNITITKLSDSEETNENDQETPDSSTPESNELSDDKNNTVESKPAEEEPTEPQKEENNAPASPAPAKYIPPSVRAKMKADAAKENSTGGVDGEEESNNEGQTDGEENSEENSEESGEDYEDYEDYEECEKTEDEETSLRYTADELLSYKDFAECKTEPDHLANSDIPILKKNAGKQQQVRGQTQRNKGKGKGKHRKKGKGGGKHNRPGPQVHLTEVYDVYFPFLGSTNILCRSNH